MFDGRPSLSIQQKQQSAGMLLHAFTHADVTYEVKFARTDGQVRNPLHCRWSASASHSALA
jgi:hypothetical protein